MSGFQKQVNVTPALAVEGDFASANPRASVLAGEGGLVAGVGGVDIGKFAWLQADAKTVLSHGSNPSAPDGFVHREQQGLITDYLAEAGSNVPEGFPVTLHSEGDFFARVTGATAATLNAAVYADYGTGEITIGSAATGAVVTASIGSTFTATGSGTDLTTTSVTGLISIGDVISGAGVVAGTTIVSQTSGTTGGAGVYVTSVATTSSAATVTSFGTALNVTAITSGTLSIGDPITGTGVPADATLTAQVSGTVGGIGVYTFTPTATAYAASTAVTSTGGVLTNYKAKSVAAVGELVKISSWG